MACTAETMETTNRMRTSTLLIWFHIRSKSVFLRAGVIWLGPYWVNRAVDSSAVKPVLVTVAVAFKVEITDSISIICQFGSGGRSATATTSFLGVMTTSDE